MGYNNEKYNEIVDAVTESPYYEHFNRHRPSPPPGAYHLLDDSGDDLLDDSGDYLITPN